ncbi:MAG: class I SAM-dependent methyltransferase [Candidatus Sumerlaeaceae bacterium]
MSTIAACYVCGNSASDLICEISTGAIVRCLDCGVVYRQSVITGDDYERLYQNDATMETPFYLTNKLASDPNKEPMPTYARGLAKLNELVKPGRLLDVGCSYGAFMEMARYAGWQVMGVELNTSTAKFAREQRGFDVFNGMIEEAKFPDASFDAVTLWDVIEHLDDPVRTLKEIHRILAPNGVIFVFTINQQSLLNTVGHLMYRVTMNRWKHLMELFYDIHHNFFFSPKTITEVLRRGGPFAVEEIMFGAANVSRWHTVPISKLMISGSDAIDKVAQPLNRSYRMFVYARK